MLSRAAKSDDKWGRVVTVFTTLVLTMSGLVLSPAHATVPSDGTYLCTTGLASSATPNFTITNGVVTDGGSCTGAVVITVGVTSIADYAFYGATALTSVTISASVTSIDEYAFDGATALTSISVDGANQTYSSVAGVLFNKDATTLITYPVGKTGTSYTIPASVTSIGVSAFINAIALSNITVPTGVASIIVSAFYGATALTSITVDGANETYSSVAGVLFNKDATTLIAYPEGKTGGSYTIPASVTSIGVYAFTLASLLVTITIPATLTNIPGGAFEFATALTSITVAGENAYYSSAAGVLFNKDATTLIAYPAGKTGTSYTIPASVTSIGMSAFLEATALTSITIPANVTSIGVCAFTGATALTSITIPASVTSIGGAAFADTSALTSVYFLGSAPTSVGTDAFHEVATDAKAYIKSGNTSFGSAGADWNGLVVTIGFYTVTYNTSGGSAVAAQNYVANFPAPTSPTRTGYTFVGWSATDGGSVITWPNTPALAIDITLYAKWTRNSAKAVATVKPVVSGTAKVSKTLTAKKGTWSGYPNPAFTYQWYACTKKVIAAKAAVPSTCKKIAGATKSTLKLAKAQKGKFISVLVTGKGTGTTATKWLSKSTAIVK